MFRRTGSTWTQLGEKLTGRAEIGAGRFGASVALSPDGKTAVIGGPGDNEGVGAAWVFRRRGSTWVQWGSKLTGSDEIGPGSFGEQLSNVVDDCMIFLRRRPSRPSLLFRHP